MRGRLHLLAYLKSALAVAVVGFAAHALTRFVPLPHVSVLFVAAVAASAALWGLGPSLFAAVLSVVSGSFFFYSPIHSFHVTDPQDIADLAMFAVVAVLTSRLAEGVRRHARAVAEARLKAQGEALREALLNSVSHDLQTPVAAILGSASVLEGMDEHAAPQARRELTTAIRAEAERLAVHIRNVLELSRIRAGQVAPRLELVELADIVNSALHRAEKALAGRALEVELAAGLPMLRVDPFLLEHAIANVLDNAAKFSPPGSPVGVAARIEGAEVVLEVRDAGHGVRAEELERVFEAFYRGSAQAAGSGLGLAICRAFVEANGGTVAVLSAGEARGTQVQIRLPISR
jgi:two-component system sensor histidine kinase KdpD